MLLLVEEGLFSLWLFQLARIQEHIFSSLQQHIELGLLQLPTHLSFLQRIFALSKTLGAYFTSLGEELLRTSADSIRAVDNMLRKPQLRNFCANLSSRLIRLLNSFVPSAMRLQILGAYFISGFSLIVQTLRLFLIIKLQV